MNAVKYMKRASDAYKRSEEEHQRGEHSSGARCDCDRLFNEFGEAIDLAQKQVDEEEDFFWNVLVGVYWVMAAVFVVGVVAGIASS